MFKAPTRLTQRMPHFTTQQSLLAFFQCREFVMHAITQQGIRWNGGEKRCLRWAIRDPNSVDKVAEELRCVASSLRHIFSAIADTERRLYEVNFHDLSENGRKMLHNFLFDIFRLQGGFTLEKCEQQCVSFTSGVWSDVLRACSCCTSTGYNSSRVQGIYIDNGFLRKDESEQVVTSLQQLGVILRRVAADIQLLGVEMRKSHETL
ncbi:hypothetical protein OUZ56_002491 [Daphnia magna]|uniref:Uncharacterized protein n=1 Tax=Daphnia magna TaxID=35525 RepID=A0ABR0A5V8_9CRUS|nr:hypothetical protein OUZ56_002491 [Daphnia magna]